MDFVQKIGQGGALGEPLYLIDFIPINFSPRKINPAEVADLYLKRGLSSSQIAEEVGLSKQAVLNRLRKKGIHNTQSRGRDSKNYRYPYAPYGYRVSEGRLSINRREMKVARLIVELRDRKNWDWTQIISLVNEKGYRSRTGLPWNHIRAKRVHKHWSGKL